MRVDQMRLLFRACLLCVAFVLALQFVPSPVFAEYTSMVPPMEWETIEAGDETTTRALDSGMDEVVKDSGGEAPPQDGSRPAPSADEVGCAIVDLRNYMYFLLYGIFPLVAAAIIVYLLMAWVFRLIVRCV